MPITAEQFARRIDRVARQIGETQRAAVNRAATTVVLPAVQAEIAADVGPDMRMSGLGRKKFGGMGGGEVTVTVRPSTSTKNSTAYVGPWGKGAAGALAILEGGTVDHVVGGKTSSRIARRGKRKDGTVTYNRIRNPRSAGRILMRTPWGPRWGPFVVGGSPAKHTFSRGIRKKRRQIREAFDRMIGDMIEESFRG